MTTTADDCTGAACAAAEATETTLLRLTEAEDARRTAAAALVDSMTGFTR